MLKPKVDELEERSKMFLFVHYPKGMRGHYFYNQLNHKLFVSTNVIFLEEDYMMSNKAKCDIDWRAIEDTLTLGQRTMCPKVPTPTILVSSSTQEPRYNGRVVVQPNRFMYLGKSFDAFLKEFETSPIDYN